VILTGDGGDLLGRTRRVLADVDALQGRAQALGGGEGGILRIGAPPQFIESALPDVLAAYRRARPGVEVQLVEDGANPLLGRVQHGELHLAVGVLRGDEGFQSRLLYPLRVLAVMSRRHRFAGRKSLRVTDLANETILMLAKGFQTRELFEEACQAAQLEPHVLLESRSPQSLVALAQAGLGVAIVPSVVKLDLSRIALAGLVHDGRPLGCWARVAWDSRRYLPSYAAEFIEELVKYMKRSYPGHRLKSTRDIARPRDTLVP
jgi:DNA-binding transcriptional LysR family regulator